MTNAPHDEDDPLLVAYMLGELDEAARWQLEQRLAAEPSLAARLGSLEALDLVGATLSAAPAGRAELRPRRSQVWLLALAAAAVAVWLLWPASRAIACEVRAVATAGFDDVGAYADALGLPRPVGARRDATAPAPAMPVPDFLVAAEGREHERGEAALAAAAAPVVAEFFTLRLRVDRDCSAVVLQLDAAGGLARRFPAPAAAPVFGEVGERLVAGRIHVLPRAVVVANRIGTLSLHPGFDVPSDVLPRRAWVLVAVRVEATGAAFLDEIDGFLAREAATAMDLAKLPAAEHATAVALRLESVRAWLRDRGFTTDAITVDGG